ncbi:MAG TPA: hypothetical protein VMU83_07355 [Hanamia sp.]|nr:hypothetical protein [Hanamia sp.]
MAINPDKCWWTALDKNQSLDLAFTLSKKALVLWDNFNFQDEIKDKLNAIKALPGIALKEIDDVIDKRNESFDEERLTNIFTLFVTPVLQIRDGNLKLPYVVKSTFLSVFNILKGILSSNDKSNALDCFSLSISRSLDAITISNILTSEEISKLTQKYFLLSGKNE